MGLKAQAESAWEEALEKDSRHPEATYNLGLSRWRSSRMDDTPLLARLGEISAERPNDWWPRYLLAQVHWERGDCASAVELLETITGCAGRSDKAQLLLEQTVKNLPRSRRCLCTVEDGHGFAIGFDGRSVQSVVLSGDGRLALSAGRDETLRLWEVSSGSCLRTFEGHKSGLRAAALSADSRFALSGSGDGTIRLWFLDWELEDKQLADWDERARPFLEVFLTLNTPYFEEPAKGNWFRKLLGRPPIFERRGKPTWTDADFQQLLHTLGC
ncbi:MAG: tetratricopeptide repeat protein, partial [Planctomycetes bacterium]|nr:tetratricopeptide repeat protein [Planctomycetota bacterium]